jgi:hypothetical protein
MHKSIIGIALIAALIIAVPASADQRAVSGFDSIAANDPVRVEITMGPTFSVNVTGDDAERVATRVEGDTLRVYQLNRPWFGSRQLDAVVRITMPDLTAIAAARGASVRAGSIQADAISLVAAMGGDIRISGTCSSVDVSASMGASINASEFACATADISAAMGAEVRANASQSAEASASMGGAINVAGGPTHRDSSASMGGSISFN